MRHIPLPHPFSGKAGVTIEVPAGQAGFQGFSPEAQIVETSNRTLVWEDDFSPGWEIRLDWIFREHDVPPIILANHPNFNGFGGLDVTYPAGSLADVRWGGEFRLPNWPTGYEEGWFSYDILFHSPYSVPALQKNVGVRAAHTGWGFPDSPPPGCADGWSCRLQIGDGLTATSDLRNPKTGEMYFYWNQATRVSEIWGGVVSGQTIPLDVVCRIELYWKSNSSFDAFDGVFRHKFDPGDATTHATPTTTRAERTDIQTYCGSEANRVNGNAHKIDVSTFFGGPVDPIWAPTVDSKFTIGRMALEIPS